MVMLAKTRKATHVVKRGDRPPPFTDSPVAGSMLLDDMMIGD